uniref:Uncharacterized protein n=1 Tax=Ditylenchus dipsaci TaxID=166011 RepID=A0A915EK45_9BILA
MHIADEKLFTDEKFNGLIWKEGIELIAKCYNNLAACILNGPVRKQQDYLRAVTYCDKVLVKEPEPEGYISQGLCLQNGREVREGHRAVQAMPQNIQALALLKECRLKEKEEGISFLTKS